MGVFRGRSPLPRTDVKQGIAEPRPIVAAFLMAVKPVHRRRGRQ
jgi:hypothetical protein